MTKQENCNGCSLIKGLSEWQRLPEQPTALIFTSRTVQKRKGVGSELPAESKGSVFHISHITPDHLVRAHWFKTGSHVWHCRVDTGQ